MFCGLGEKEHTRFSKKKKEIKVKKRKKMDKNIVAEIGLVGIKECLMTYNRVKYILPYLSRL